MSASEIERKLDHDQKLQERKEYHDLRERAELDDEDLSELPHDVYIKLIHK